jgi:hypothetical protein
MKSVFTFFNRKTVLMFSIFLLTGVMVNAQLKIGDNPTNIQKSSILELESSRQGLLLPRLADTAAINALNPPDGMIIYLNSDKSLRLRSNGSWKKIADLGEASSNWSLKGNSGIDSTLDFVGTADGRPVVLRTNNTERMRISSNGNVGIGTNTPSAKLNVEGSVKFENLAGGSTELEVLVLAADGSVYKRTMSSAAFENAIKAINGLQKQTLNIDADISLTTDTVQIQNRASDSTIAIYLPVQNGSAGASKPYGMLTYSDWQDVQSAIQVITIGAVASTADAKGASVEITDSSRTIILHPADATNPGIVTAGTQTFGGDKTFNGTVTLNNVGNNSNIDSVLVINNGLVQKRQVSAAAFGNAVRRINDNTDTAQVIAFRNFGTDVSVTTNGADSIYLNVPSASATARGLMTTTAQTFAGTKTFEDSVIAKAVMIGSPGSANSTMQIDGSLAMAIKTVSADYSATAADNTLLANTTSASVAITLPSASGIAGRIYTIKKIGTGGLDNALTITPAAGTIDGGSSFVIYNDWSYVTLQTDGSNWFIIRK